MGWPQYAYIALTLLGAGYAVAQHGQLKTGWHDMWSSFVATGLILFLLYKGGFFQ